MFKSAIIYLFLLALVPQIYGQLVYDLPGNLGYDNNLAQDYISDRLASSELEEEERQKLICIQSRIYNAKGKYETADSLLSEENIGPNYKPRQKFELYLAKANVKKFVTEPKIADSLFAAAYALSKAQNQDEWRVQTLIEWAEFCRKYSEYTAGRVKLNEALEILENVPNSADLKAYAYNRKAAIYNERVSNKESLNFSRLAIQYALKAKNNFILAVSYNEIGYSYRRLDKKDSVIFYYQKANKAFGAAGMDVEAARAKFNELEYKFAAFSNYPHVDKEVEKFIDSINDNNIPYPLRDSYLLLTRLYDEKGDYKRAYDNLWNFHNLDHEFFKASVEKELVSVRKKFKNAQFDIENQSIKEDLAKRKREIERKNNLIQIVVGGFIIIVFILILIYLSYKKSKKLSEELKEQNKEKDFLIQEVHHRVKNNLNFIQSLLDLQERASTDINQAKALNEASVRINSVSMVHEMLYNDDANGKVDLQKYIVDLIKNLDQTYEGASIQTKVDVDPISLNIQKSTAIGLLITECFNNSVKHAFADIEEPEFSVSLIHIDINKNIKFSISDNGTKSMDLSEVKKTNSLGMRLIDIFSRQLQGEYSIEIADGFKYQLWMKNEEENSNR